MSFLDQIRKLFSSAPASQPASVTPASTSRTKQSPPAHKLEPIGTTETVCPYCGVIPTTKPQRKTKCRSCGNYIYVRTRPTDQQRVLLTEEQTKKLEEQWTIVNGTHDEWLAEQQDYEDTKALLTARFGRAPSHNDIQWTQVNAQLTEHAKRQDWGGYRNAKFEMAELLRKEKKCENALSGYLEVCYLDLNGPQNCGGWGHTPADYPAFSPEQGILAPGVLSRIDRMSSELDFSIEQIEDKFRAIAVMNQSALRLPVSPDDAWERLRPRLIIFDQDEEKD